MFPENIIAACTKQVSSEVVNVTVKKTINVVRLVLIVFFYEIANQFY